MLNEMGPQKISTSARVQKSFQIFLGNQFTIWTKSLLLNFRTFRPAELHQKTSADILLLLYFSPTY